MSFINIRKIRNFYLALFILLIQYSKQIKPFEMSILRNETELGFFHINYTHGNIICEELVPSLFNPIFLTTFQKYEDKTEIPSLGSINTIAPIFHLTENFNVFLYNYAFLDLYNVVIGEERLSNLLKRCYLGLLSKIGYDGLDENYIFLNIIKKSANITKRIFSFDKWRINNESDLINTTFYLGEEHENFNLVNKKVNGTIGNCKVNEDYNYWGCNFTEISWNNITKNLKDNNDSYYKIYFSSENYEIVLPNEFLSTFQDLTDGHCIYAPDKTKKKYAICNNSFFNNDNYAEIKLISYDMNITIEIDNQKRFTKGNDDDKKDLSRIRFDKINYFILPLIMFKRFDIQFDAENNIVQFYTTDNSILQVRKKEKEKNKSSNAGKVFLIIFIIILILALGFGVFLLIKKRKNSVEKNINKYNKFDEDDNFQNMNEKRVF